MLTLKQSRCVYCMGNFYNVRENIKTPEILSAIIHVRNKPNMSEILSAISYRDLIFELSKKVGNFKLG